MSYCFPHLEICIPPEALCNGTEECSDGWDEKNCSGFFASLPISWEETFGMGISELNPISSSSESWLHSNDSELDSFHEYDLDFMNPSGRMNLDYLSPFSYMSPNISEDSNFSIIFDLISEETREGRSIFNDSSPIEFMYEELSNKTSNTSVKPPELEPFYID